MYSSDGFVSFASLVALTTFAYASFDLLSNANVAVYWGKSFSTANFYDTSYQNDFINTSVGQNSHNQGSGPLAQQRLVYYCASKTSSLHILMVLILKQILGLM